MGAEYIRTADSRLIRRGCRCPACERMREMFDCPRWVPRGPRYSSVDVRAPWPLLSGMERARRRAGR